MDPHQHRIALDADFLAQLKEEGVRNVLEVCCGDGENLKKFADAGFAIIGVDNEHRYTEHGSVVKHDIFTEPLPFDDGSFDYVYSYQYINHAYKERILFVFKEIRRVLKEGAHFSLRSTDFDQVNFKKVEEDLYEEQDPEFGSMRYRMIAPQTFIKLFGDEKGIPHYAFCKEELRKDLVLIGFRNVTIRTMRWNLVVDCEK